MTHGELQSMKSFEQIVKISNERGEISNIYSQYTVDTGLLETVNNIMLDQMFNAYASQSVHRANLGLMVGLYKFQIHGSIDTEFIKTNALSKPKKDKEVSQKTGKQNFYVLGDKESQR